MVKMAQVGRTDYNIIKPTRVLLKANNNSVLNMHSVSFMHTQNLSLYQKLRKTVSNVKYVRRSLHRKDSEHSNFQKAISYNLSLPHNGGRSVEY